VQSEGAAIDLCSALETLRQELEQVWVAGQGRRVSFRIPEVTLTVQVTARRENKAEGRLRWWLVEGGGGHSSGHEDAQTLVLTLNPQFRDDVGGTAPLEVTDTDQSEPGS
jgi:hypothetical protein